MEPKSLEFLVSTWKQTTFYIIHSTFHSNYSKNTSQRNFSPVVPDFWTPLQAYIQSNPLHCHINLSTDISPSEIPSRSVKDFEPSKLKHLILIFRYLLRTKCHNTLPIYNSLKVTLHRRVHWGNKCQCKGQTHMTH